MTRAIALIRAAVARSFGSNAQTLNTDIGTSIFWLPAHRGASHNPVLRQVPDRWLRMSQRLFQQHRYLVQHDKMGLDGEELRERFSAPVLSSVVCGVKLHARTATMLRVMARH